MTHSPKAIRSQASATTNVPMTSESAQRTARELDQQARTHKRAEFQHRKQAREARRLLDEHRARCAELGIPIILVDTAPQRRHSHHAGNT